MKYKSIGIMQETLQKAHMLKDCVQSLVSAGKCGLGKEKEEVNHHCTIKKKRCQTSLQGKYKTVWQICAHKPVETEWFVHCFTTHSPSSQRHASLRKSCLTKDTEVDLVSTQISVKLSAAEERHARQEKNAKSICGLIGGWSESVMKSQYSEVCT